MGYAIYRIGGRDCGYGVPAICDYPDCSEDIDRGLAYVCGNDAGGGEQGCGLYFCFKHLMYVTFVNEEGIFEDSTQVCDACGLSLKLSGDYKMSPARHEPKPDVLEWVLWKLHDQSWETWRTEHANEAWSLRVREADADQEEVKALLAELEPQMEQNQ